jgi:cytochrome c6
MRGNILMTFLLSGALTLFVFCAAGAGANDAGSRAGEAGFKEYCSECHADGGNIVNPAKTLSRADREKNGVTTAKDIIGIMRRPGAGMVQFDEKTLPQAQAEEIADYILHTFK